MVLPIVKAFTDNASLKDFRTALVILFLFDLLFSTINALNAVIGFYLPIKGNALFYLLMGRYLDIRTKELSRCYEGVMFILSCVIMVIIGIVASTDNVRILSGYSSPITALLTISVFLLVTGRTFACREWLWKLDRLCFCVYLVHPVFTNLVYKYLKISPLVFGNYVFIGIICFFFSFTVLGFTSSWVINKIPILRENVL